MEMKMKHILAIALASTVMSASAFAADAIIYNEPAPASAPFVAPGFDWTGPYIGIQAGYAWADLDNIPGVGSADADGVLGGFHAGYNYDFGGFVVGGELDYDFANVEIDGGLGEIDGVARAKLRAGADLGQVLVYGTAGGAYATADTVLGDFSDFGWLVGAGVDFAATDKIIVGAEYLYHDFSDFDNTGLDVNVHTLKAKASFKF
jgi:outer membrane immunogenic protein